MMIKSSINSPSMLHILKNPEVFLLFLASPLLYLKGLDKLYLAYCGNCICNDLSLWFTQNTLKIYQYCTSCLLSVTILKQVEKASKL